MFTDVVDLDEFYRSPLGHVARRTIRRQIRAIWPEMRGMALLGLGHATPYLTPFRNEAERVLAIAPAAQGVIPWPNGGPGQVALSQESELPLPDLCIDRLLMVHAVESSEQLRAMMREAWRVLKGNGRMLIVAPNRASVWARSERTPFGHGHPYTNGQIRRLLRDSMFTPGETRRALYLPPINRRLVVKAAPVLERAGNLLFQTFAGVLLVEASKQVYAASAGKAVARRRFVVLPGGAEPAAEGGVRREVD
jgi:SAM-dependent methyltransferase